MNTINYGWLEVIQDPDLDTGDTHYGKMHVMHYFGAIQS